MSCTPASRVPPSPHSMITITEPTDADVPIPTERRASRAYQIFPPMSESECERRDAEELGRERLPSIVVEPTEVNEVESGELRWPVSPEEDEDPFQEGSPARTESPAGTEYGGRKSSIGPAQAQINCNRLTPPSSPTAREAFPPSRPKELRE